MYLLLGHPEDPCCAEARALLVARGHQTRLVTAPLSAPSRFAWRLDAAGLSSRVAWDDDEGLDGERIAGVLVRDSGWIDPAGWDPIDLAYMQAETHAAMLAWLSGLTCPVINRCAPALWYRPRMPLLAWRAQLRRAGLPVAEVLVTNDPAGARAFGEARDPAAAGGAVYAPLTSEARYLVADARDWRGLAALQERAPVCLTEPHGAAHRVCVVGDAVVWDGDPPPGGVALEPALRRFAAAAGLAFVELALASGRAGPRSGLHVAMVDPLARLEHFADRARSRIVAALVGLLTCDAASPRTAFAEETA